MLLAAELQPRLLQLRLQDREVRSLHVLQIHRQLSRKSKFVIGHIRGKYFESVNLANKQLCFSYQRRHSNSILLHLRGPSRQIFANGWSFNHFLVFALNR